MTSQIHGTKNSCLMKRINSIFFAAAAAALSLVSCSQENLAPTEKPQGELVTVHFGAESGIASSTKATLTTEDEATFSSAWADGDVLSVEYNYDNDDNNAGIVDATWNVSSNSFDTQLPSYTGIWMYDAVYPAPGSDGTVDFGSSRTQNGSNYNSIYDLMEGSAVADNAAEGKDDFGKDIIFEMNRQTAIAYFHLTSGLDEEVVSATLSVEGEVAAIASSVVKPLDYSKGFDLSTKDLKSITITYEDGTAPKANDFQLWFNVLPTIYDKMTLTVETTGHTMSISRTSKEDTYEAGKLYKVVKTIPTDKWVEKTSQTTGFKLVKSEESDWSGKYVLAAVNGTVYYAFDESSTTGDWGKVVKIDVVDERIDASNSPLAIEIVKGSSDGAYAIKTQSGKYFSASAKGKFNITDSYSATNCDFIISIDETYAVKIQQKSSTSNRQMRYNHSSGNGGFRWYENTTGTLALLFKDARASIDTPSNLKVEAETKTVSWDAVANAGSYIVTIGDETFDASTNSYVASAIEDEYYDVTVVAVPSDKDNFKNSAVAELKDAKFGTPKLNKPELKEGVVDENSINVTWTLDSRASEGYYCAIYNGESKIAEDMVTEGSVSFNGLSEGNEYIIKVNASAVAGEKPYEASAITEIKISTKAAKHVSDVTSTGTYTIKGLTVYAVMGTKNAIVGDETGYILFYNASSLGLEIGDTFDAAGNVVRYNGVFEYSNATVSNKQSGSSPTYENPVEATEDYLKNYMASSSVQYVHIRGIQSGKVINVGSVAVSMYANSDVTDGKYVDAYGYVYGYKSPNVHFVMTSIAEDHSVPTLAVDKTSKTWASDGVEPFVVKVTVNSDGGDWDVTPTSLVWATVIADKAAGTITVTPNGKNESDKANEAILTVAHVSDPTLTKTITLKQNAAGEAVQKTVTLDLTAQGYSSGSAVKSLTVSPITVSFGKGSNTSNDPKYYTSKKDGNAVRCYGGNTFTLSGAAINKVEISFGSGEGSNEITTDSGTFKDGVWTGTSSSVKFTIGGTTGHRRIQKLTVTYKE